MLLVTSAVVVGCASTNYWTQAGVGVQVTARDLSECRMAGNQGGQKIFSAQEIESPCMASRGYKLSKTPPSGP